MNKEFCPYLISLKLKKLGFDEPCFGYYTPMKDWMMKGKYSDEKLHFHGPNWANEDNTFYFMYKSNVFGDRTETVCNSGFTKAIHNIAVPLWQQAVDFFREKHDIHIAIETLYRPKKYNKLMYCYCISYKDNFYGGMDDNLDAWLELSDDGVEYHICGNYKEALEQAILKAIELIKEK